MRSPMWLWGLSAQEGIEMTTTRFTGIVGAVVIACVLSLVVWMAVDIHTAQRCEAESDVVLTFLTTQGFNLARRELQALPDQKVQLRLTQRSDLATWAQHRQTRCERYAWQKWIPYMEEDFRQEQARRAVTVVLPPESMVR